MNHAIVSEKDVALGVECALPPGYGLAPAGARAARPADGSATRRARALFVLTGLLLALGAWQFGQSLAIHAKAQLAQVLIRSAWMKTLAGERAVKPWPWADTWPVARMSVPGEKIELYVLAGANGRTIAFGPGHMYGTPLPGEAGNSVIGGHRDTHLAFLARLKPGTDIMIERQDGTQRHYRVSSAEVLDKRDVWVAKNEGPTRLTLVTCYPFDAIRAGGPQRYVIIARAVN